MESSPPTVVETRQVAILVLDNDTKAQGALRQILDSEGWRVRIVPDTNLFLTELKSGEWSLVIVNVGITGVSGPLFSALSELNSVSPEDGARVRVLHLVPELAGRQYIATLEQARLPYVVRPFHLHDFLEKVSDLLVEIKAIQAPIRQVRHEFGEMRKKKRPDTRMKSMFAARDSFSYTDEEMAEYERQESESSRNKRAKPRTNLGDPNNR
jgi:DNA-binding response OmpR family regulator